MSTFPDGGQATPGGRRAMSYGLCLALIVAGSVLRFALTVRSPHGLNVHVVGVILILAGVLGLILPFLARLPRDRRRRPVPPGRPPTADLLPGHARRGAAHLRRRPGAVPGQPDRIPDPEDRSLL
jgi:hypothetical protein